MRNKKLFGLLGTLTLAAAGVAAFSGVRENKAQEVKATDYSSTIRIYLDKGGWGIDSAWVNKVDNSFIQLSNTPDDLDSGKKGELYTDLTNSTALSSIYFKFYTGSTENLPDHGSWDINRKIENNFAPGNYYVIKVTGAVRHYDNWQYQWFTYSITSGELPKANPATVNLHVLERDVAVQHGSLTENYTPNYIFYNTDKPGYYFDGWYEDSTYKTKYSPRVLAAETTLNLYAKFTQFSEIDVYINFFDWDSTKLGVYSEEVINGVTYGKNYNVTLNDGNLFFNGSHEHHLQKVTLQSSKVAELKINYYSTDGLHNSSDFTNISEGSYFLHDGSNWVEKKAGNSDGYADAAKFVYDLNNARLSIGASGSIKAFSICGLNAKDWVDRYDQLSANAKALVDSASIFTYKDQSSSGADTRYDFGEVIGELRLLSSGTSSRSVSLIGFNIFGNDSESNLVLIISIISLVGLTSIGGYFFYRKRREN